MTSLYEKGVTHSLGRSVTANQPKLWLTPFPVQFNRSVSAMPPPPARTFETPAHPGTADTLLLRWAVSGNRTID
jgi:hypothetical protein